MSYQQTGLLIATAGAALILIGLIVWAGGLSWFGRLPGDIRIERDNIRVFLPLASMLLISVVLSVGLTVALRLIRRWFS